MTRWNEAGGTADAGAERGGSVERRALAVNEVLALPPGATVRVEFGQVVITVEGDAEDHVLDGGAALELPRRGRALAWALGPSRIALTVPSVWAWRRRSSTGPSSSQRVARPPGARPWQAPRPS